MIGMITSEQGTLSGEPSDAFDSTVEITNLAEPFPCASVAA